MLLINIDEYVPPVDVGLGVLLPVHLDEYVPPVDVGLGVVSSHADGLPVEGVSLLQASAVAGDEVRQVQEHVQVVGCYPSLVTLTRFSFR